MTIDFCTMLHLPLRQIIFMQLATDIPSSESISSSCSHHFHIRFIISSTTPEFCVNVTEIQLSSDDTKADVGLSLVNRTERRLFIALTGPTSLTDSNGGKWNTGDSKGLGNLSNPVPLEPRGEIQGTITFYQILQSPMDRPFSLVGEIGIMKMGTRGQAVPGQIARKHQITLSGIRIRHQRPPSTGATEQNKGAKLTQLFPRRTKPTAPTSSASSKSSAPCCEKQT